MVNGFRENGESIPRLWCRVAAVLVQLLPLISYDVRIEQGGGWDCAPPRRWLTADCVELSHGIALDGDDVRVVNDPVADYICQRRIVKVFMPAGDVELGAEYRGSCLVSRLNDLQQIPRLCLLRRTQQPFMRSQYTGVFLNAPSSRRLRTIFAECMHQQRGQLAPSPGRIHLQTVSFSIF